MTDEEMHAILARAGAEDGDVVLIIADSQKQPSCYDPAGRSCGCEVAGKLGIVDDTGYNFLWVVEFPLFEYDEEVRPVMWPCTIPFTAPMDE